IEVHDGGAAANPFDPEVLHAGNLGGEVRLGDDHLGGERLIDAVPSPVEIGQQGDPLVPCDGDLEGVRAGALEPRRSQQLRRVPTHTSAGGGNPRAAPERPRRRNGSRPPNGRTSRSVRCWTPSPGRTPPPPVRFTTPVGKPLTVPLKPKAGWP